MHTSMHAHYTTPHTLTIAVMAEVRLLMNNGSVSSGTTVSNNLSVALVEI